MNDQLNETLLGWVDALNGPLWDFLVVFLVAVGILYTIMTGAVQIRLFWHSIKVMKRSRGKVDDDHGITPFQAFVTGLASRVGVGNVAGVELPHFRHNKSKRRIVVFFRPFVIRAIAKAPKSWMDRDECAPNMPRSRRLFHRFGEVLAILHSTEELLMNFRGFASF